MGLIRPHPILAVLALLLLAAARTFLATSLAVWRAPHTDEARRPDHVDPIVVLGAPQRNGRPAPVLQRRSEQGALAPWACRPTCRLRGTRRPGASGPGSPATGERPSPTSTIDCSTCEAVRAQPATGPSVPGVTLVVGGTDRQRS